MTDSEKLQELQKIIINSRHIINKNNYWLCGLSILAITAAFIAGCAVGYKLIF